MIARSAILDDAEAIAAIYNQGIEEGIATFETRLRTADDVKKWFDDRFPIIVVENGGGQVVIAGSQSSRSTSPDPLAAGVPAVSLCDH